MGRHARWSATLAVVLVTAVGCERNPDPAPPPAGPDAPSRPTAPVAPHPPADAPAAPEAVDVNALAHVSEMTGDVVLHRGGEAVPLGNSSPVRAGDRVRLTSADALLTLRFSDGATLTLAGPAELGLVAMDATGRRVRLYRGTIRHVKTWDVALEVQVPSESGGLSLVLQNASAVAEVGEDGGVEFRETEGDYVRLWRENALHELTDGRWSSSER